VSQPKSNPLTVTLVGDLMLAGVFSEEYESLRESWIPSGLRSWFDSDIVFGNLEAPCGGGEAMAHKVLHQSSVESLESLQSLGFNCVSLANNHIFDYGVEGFRLTKSRLKELGIADLGAGLNLKESGTPAVLETASGRVAILAYSWSDEWQEKIQAATTDGFGIYPLEKERIIADVQHLKTSNQIKYVIVSLHWGEGLSRFPRPSCRALARAVAEAGADIIVGHHTHCHQGYEVWEGCPIFYSLGNFVCSQYTVVDKTSGKLKTRDYLERERTSTLVRLELAANKPIISDFVFLLQSRKVPVLKFLEPDSAIDRKVRQRFQLLCFFLKSPFYPLLYPILRRLDEITRMLEELKEDGVKKITLRTPLNSLRKFITGRNLH